MIAPRASFLWLAAAAFGLGGCAIWDQAKEAVVKVQELPLVEAIGLGVDLPCDTDLYEARRLAGAYLQTVVGVAGGTTFPVTGKAANRSTAPLPGNIAIDDKVVRGVRPDETGTLTGWRQSTAVPIAALNSTATLPLAYTLSYRAAATDFTGPLVVGIPPLQETVPRIGRAVFEGPILLDYTAIDAQGAATTSRATGRFAMQVGFGSGRGEFRASNLTVQSGPALPFATLRWTRLGVCGARLVSTGQGILTMQNSDGAGIAPLGPDAAPDEGTFLFEASQFIGPDPSAGPAALGGVFAVQGDAVYLTAAFLSPPPPP